MDVNTLTDKIKKNKKDHSLFFERGKCYLVDEENELAKEDFNSAINLVEKSKELKIEDFLKYFLKRGEVSYELGCYSEAINDFNICINLSSNKEVDNNTLSEYYNLRGLSKTKLKNQISSGIEDLTKAIDLCETPEWKSNYFWNRFIALTQPFTHKKYSLKRRRKMAMLDLGEALKLYTEEEEKLSCRKERISLRNYIPSETEEERKEEIEDLNFVIDHVDFEERLEFFLRRISINKKLGNYESCKCDLDIVINEFWDDLKKPYDFKEKRAYCNLKIGNFKESVKELEEILEYFPRKMECYRIRSRVNEELGEKLDEINDITEYLKIKYQAKNRVFTRRDAYMQKKRAEYYYENEEYELATHDYLLLLKRASTLKDAVIRLRIFKSIYEFGRRIYFNKAIDTRYQMLGGRIFEELYEKSRKKLVNFLSQSNLLLFLGRSYRRGGKYHKCVETINLFMGFEQSKKGNSSKFCLFLLGSSYFSLRNHQKAAEYLRKLYFLDEKYFNENNNGKAKLYLGKSSKRIGNVSEAFFFNENSPEVPKKYQKRGVVLEGGYISNCKPNSKLGHHLARTHIFAYQMMDFSRVEDKQRLMKMILEGHLKYRKKTNFFSLMMEELFGKINNQEYDERIDFIIESGLLEEIMNIEIKWRNGSTIHLPKYFLLTDFSSEIDLDLEKIESTHEVIMDDNSPLLNHRATLKYIFGLDVNNTELSEIAVPLCSIFTKLGLQKSVYLLCERVCKSLDLKNRIRLFAQCIEIFEKAEENSENENNNNNDDDGSNKIDYIEEISSILDGDSEDEDESSEDDNISFVSVLSLSVFNSLKRSYNEIENSRRFEKALTKLGYFNILRNYKNTKSILFHPFFEDENEKQQGFFSYFGDDYKRMYGSMLNEVFECEFFGSIFLSPGNDDTVQFKVEKEILIARSNFFFRMFKFPGIESNSECVDVQGISEKGLILLLRNIYGFGYFSIKSKLEKMEIHELFQLLIHCEMYDDHNLKLKVIGMLDDKMIELARNMDHDFGGFSLKILENGKYFLQLPDYFRKIMVEKWCFIKGINRGDLQTMIDHSIKVNELAEKLEDSEKKLEKKIEKREKRKRKRLEIENNDDVNTPDKKKKKFSVIVERVVTGVLD